MNRNIWKKLFGLTLALALLFALTACGQQPTQEEGPTPPEQEEQQEQEQPEAENTTASSGSGKALVVYFSASGNTKAVAETIAATLDAPTYEIIPAQPYTQADLNWTDDGSRVNAEHENPALQRVELSTTTVVDWDSYDTVFIGYPIWWGIAAWPTTSFVEANDFTGKTVIPFCTSTSSGLGQSGQLLADAAGSGTWLEGQRFPSSGADADVIAWVNSLGLKG